MKRTLCVFLALFLVFSLLPVQALGAGEDRSFEPVTVADDESVKVVVTDLVNAPETSAASFTLEITNKTEMGLEFTLTAFSANDRMCPLSWIDGHDPSSEAVTIPSGETRSVSAGWDMPALAQVGVNYVQSADGYLSAVWSNDYYMEKYDEAGDDTDALLAVDEQYYAFELLIPFSLPVPDAEMDIPATEEIVYDTAFEPVTIVDDEGVTAIVHDYYFDHDHRSEYSDEEIGHSLVISVENRTGEMLGLHLDGAVDGSPAAVNSSQWVPSGKTLVESINYYILALGYGVELTSANTLHLNFALLDEENVIYGNYSTSLDLDVSPYADVTSSVHGTAAWVADPTPPETPQPTEGPAEEDASSDETESAELTWIPDPEADAVVTLGDSGEYLVGVLKDERIFPGITFYFENNGDIPIDWIDTAEVLVDGEPVECVFAFLGMPFTLRPGSACNYAIGDTQPALPADGFDMQIELEFYMEGSGEPILNATLAVAFAADGSATIGQVS